MAAIKLTKSEVEKVEKIQAQLEESSQKLADAIDDYNDQIGKLNAPVTAAFEAYKRALEKVNKFTEQVVERISTSIDDRTEDWQDSDDGHSSTELLESWRDFRESMTDYLEPELPLIDELETPELLDHNLSLYDLPQDAND